MKLKLVLAILLAVTTRLQSQGKDDDNDASKCSYFGEPHLIPFATLSSPTQNQYVCHPNAQETLVKNQFLEILVTTNPMGNYPIVGYTVTFYPTGGFSLPCVLTDSTTGPPNPPPSCPPGSPAKTVGGGPSQSHIHLTENIQVDIDSQGGFFDIYVTQSSALISQSKGVCIDYKCDLEIPNVRRKRRQTASSAVFTILCSIYTDFAQKRAFGDVHQNTIASRQTACEYDTSATLYPQYGRTSVTSILRESVKQYQSLSNYQDYLRKAGEAAKDAISKAEEAINSYIGTIGPTCKVVNWNRQCLQRLSVTT